jgi:hypothetical protein
MEHPLLLEIDKTMMATTLVANAIKTNAVSGSADESRTQVWDPGYDASLKTPHFSSNLIFTRRTQIT